jgi:hypothetical protein
MYQILPADFLKEVLSLCGDPDLTIARSIVANDNLTELAVYSAWVEDGWGILSGFDNQGSNLKRILS